ncbi:MAG: hypothetical protein EG826_15885 [Deltaproteobacteria bacterium]|nr:hypothetical protein [Deltaproteobacteria bacterium]
MSLLGGAGTKTFWQDTNDYFNTNSAQCKGCGSLLATKLILRTIYETTPNAMVFGRSCGAGRSELQTGGRIGCDGSGLMGIQMAMEARNQLPGKKLIVLSGEGRTLEMGCGDFISAFDREQKASFIVLDNQAYANSGSAATAMTPQKAATRIHTREGGGKQATERDMPLMMLFSKARYVATAASAYVRDLVVKVQEAIQIQPSYLHVVVPCQVSWIYSPDQGVQISRRLVQTGMVPLWSYKNGKFKRTVKIPADQRIPVKELLQLQGRYARLTEDDVKEIEARIVRKNNLVDALEQSLTGPDKVAW